MITATTELEAFIDESISISQKNGYYPTVFISMRKRHRTLGAITKLVQSGDIQSGFKKLKSLGLLEWTIESAVIKFSKEFSDATVECAKFRLSLV